MTEKNITIEQMLADRFADTPDVSQKLVDSIVANATAEIQEQPQAVWFVFGRKAVAAMLVASVIAGVLTGGGLPSSRAEKMQQKMVYMEAENFLFTTPLAGIGG